MQIDVQYVLLNFEIRIQTWQCWRGGGSPPLPPPVNMPLIYESEFVPSSVSCPSDCDMKIIQTNSDYGSESSIFRTNAISLAMKTHSSFKVRKI